MNPHLTPDTFTLISQLDVYKNQYHRQRQLTRAGIREHSTSHPLSYARERLTRNVVNRERAMETNARTNLTHQRHTQGEDFPRFTGCYLLYGDAGVCDVCVSPSMTKTATVIDSPDPRSLSLLVMFGACACARVCGSYVRTNWCESCGYGFTFGTFAHTRTQSRPDYTLIYNIRQSIERHKLSSICFLSRIEIYV